jgi:TRAP-type uncharacterized transport system fused permease subunit
MWQAGFAAMRAAAPAYIVPFMFVYEPRLLLITKDWSADWLFVAWSAFSASVGVIALAGGLFGWLLAFATMWQRVLLVIAALCLITPGLVTDSIGFGLLAVVVGAQLLGRRRVASQPARS